MPDERDGLQVVLMPTEIDMSSAARVRAALTRPLADGITVLVADMTATGYLTLEGLHALLRVRAAAAAAGAQLRLAAVSPAVRRILERTGADRIFQVYPSLDAARLGSA